jgi:hypothetical protein
MFMLLWLASDIIEVRGSRLTEKALRLSECFREQARWRERAFVPTFYFLISPFYFYCPWVDLSLFRLVLWFAQSIMRGIAPASGRPRIHTLRWLAAAIC